MPDRRTYSSDSWDKSYETVVIARRAPWSRDAAMDCPMDMGQ